MHVLVAVDDAEVRRSLCESLRCLAHSVEELTGPTVPKAVGRFHPDAVFIGIRPPEPGGYELARQLRQWADRKELLLAAVILDAEHSLAGLIPDDGFDVHFIAPVDLPLLDGLLRNHDLTRSE
jgi:CheY-like chemotaxis protein